MLRPKFAVEILQQFRVWWLAKRLKLRHHDDRKYDLKAIHLPQEFLATKNVRLSTRLVGSGIVIGESHVQQHEIRPAPPNAAHAPLERSLKINAHLWKRFPEKLSELVAFVLIVFYYQDSHNHTSLVGIAT